MMCPAVWVKIRLLHKPDRYAMGVQNIFSQNSLDFPETADNTVQLCVGVIVRTDAEFSLLSKGVPL